MSQFKPAPAVARRRARRLVLAPTLGALALLAGCDWVALARNALTYREISDGEAGNLVAPGSLLYVTRAGLGVEILDAGSGRVLATLPPEQPGASADDVAAADGLLFVLDARAPGALSVYSLSDPVLPRLVSTARDVPVGPFSGVSAAGGVCIVSGGTSELTLWRYDSTGTLSGPVATADLGRGQPDVLVGREGRTAFVSTHRWGPYFALDVARVDAAGGRFERSGRLELDGAGFTEGGSKPANFPIEAALLGADTVLVAHARGVSVIGIGEGGAPRLLKLIDVGGPAVNVDTRGGRAAVAVGGQNSSLLLLDFSAGADGRIVRRFALSGARPSGVALLDGRAAVAAGDRGVLVFEL
jgi:hypothetical protein